MRPSLAVGIRSSSGRGAIDTPLNENSSKKLVYEGQFGGKLKWLRRVSFASSLLSVTGIPIIVFSGIGGGSIPLAGQVVIVGTALFTSLSSTAFLHAGTHDYWDV
jgi:hypothetical protein